MGLPLMQIPKAKGFFAAFEAPPDHDLVYGDWSSVEPHVMAYYSRDPGLLGLYGPDAKPNDLYIYFGHSIPGCTAQIEALGYDPKNPTKEAIKAVKAAMDGQRQVWKAAALGLIYGMGWYKLREELTIKGFPTTEAEAKTYVESYWKLFGGVKKWEQQLLKEWAANDGYVLNGRGRPMAIPYPKRVWSEEDKKYITVDLTKDICNRFVQSTAHDINMRLIMHMHRMRMERNIPMRPFMVDWHDSTNWACPKTHTAQALQVFKDAVELINSELGWDVKLKMNPKVGQSLADFLED